jgi:Asp-tRNA(Asn)/Glu-tRNA(Gln) amidotransferase A subunit family amidase
LCITSPLAATVSDLTIAYRVMSQPNPHCPVQGRFALSQPPAPSAKRVMGVYRDWWRMADPKVADVCERAMDWFAREKGYEIVDIEIPYLAEARVAHGMICISEMAEEARRRTPNPADWLSIVNPANKILLSVGSQTPTADFLKCNSLRELLMRHMAFLFQKYPGLLIMTPTTGIAGWPIKPGEETYGISDTNKTLESMAYIFLSNLTGTPSLSAPVGYVKPEQGEGDLPIGLMAMGEWGSEEQLLAWAGEAEEYVHDKLEGSRRRPKAWLDVMELVKNGGQAN